MSDALSYRSIINTILNMHNTYFFFPSNAVRNTYEYFYNKNFKKFPVIPNFLPIDQDTSINTTLQKSKNNEELIVGGVFRLEHQKCPIEWLQVAHLVLKKEKNIKFIIIGSGQMELGCENYIKNHNLEENIDLVKPSKNIQKWYRRFDLLLHTAVTEGFSNVLLEAHYYGIPIISSDVGGASESIEKGATGFIVESHSIQKFAEKLIGGINNPEWRNRASIKAHRKNKDEFNEMKVFNQFYDQISMIQDKDDLKC